MHPAVVPIPIVPSFVLRAVAPLASALALAGGAVGILPSPARAAWDGSAWADPTPYLSPLTPSVRSRLLAIRLVGEAQGRVVGRMGQFGDSITESSAFFRNAVLHGSTANETGHDYAPIRSWLAYGGSAPADPQSFYRDYGKGPDWGNDGGWTIASAAAAGHPDHAVTVGDGSTVGDFSWALVMFGTNDVDDAGWAAAPWKEEVRTWVQGLVDLGVVPVLSTIPPEVAHVGDGRIEAANDAIRALGVEMEILVVDYYAWIVDAQPGTWAGTLIGPDGTHPSGAGTDFSQTGLTTTDGYAARTKLAFDVAEVLRTEVFDFDPTGIDEGIRTSTWGRTRAGFR